MNDYQTWPDLEEELVDEGRGHPARDWAQPVNPVVRPAAAGHHGRAQGPRRVHTRACRNSSAI